MDQQNEPKVAIITGASSGIGMETALAMARRKYAVVLAARREDRLDDISRQCQALGATAMVRPTDVADEKQVESLVAETMDRFGRVDVMVNNAGYGLFARVHETSTEAMREIFDVNYFGLFYGCKAVVPIMIRQKNGHIFNVSSVIGKRGTPFHGAYCATKFAVCGLTDTLRVEMKPYNIRVTCVCPALTETEFFSRTETGRKAQSSWKKLKGYMPAEKVARKMAATVGKSKPELVFTMGGKFLAAISALFPRAADVIMRAYHNDLARKLK